MNKKSLQVFLPLLLLINLFLGAVPAAQAQTSGPPVSLQKYMMIDQFGYRPEDDKVAVLVDPQSGYNSADAYMPGPTLEVRRVGDDDTVFTGEPVLWNNGSTQSSSGDRGWWFDFSSVTAEGEYYLWDPQNNSKSFDFAINKNVYKDVLKAAIKTFYYQRIGTPHLPEHAGAAYADGAAFLGPHQDSEARNVFDRNNPATERDLSGGWMDAGDFNKYVTYTAQPVNELLSAYEQNPDIFTDDYDIPESGNGIPDVLDEVKWELDWLIKMQENDGGVLLKVGVPSSGQIGEFANPPSAITSYRYYLPKASSSTIVTALNFAHAALVYREFPSLKSYADDLQQRAVQAWDWYQANPKSDDADKGEIEAGDADMSLQSQAQIATIASVYLYALTGEDRFHSEFKNNYKSTWPLSDGYWGMYYGEQADGVMFYTTLPNADPAVRSYILERRDVQDFDEAFHDDDDLYRAFVPDFSYHWGSLQVRARLGATAYDFVQYEINPSKKENYDKRAKNILHYFHGVNPNGFTYLTNMSEYGAEHSISQIYHSWFADGSQWDLAPPGFVPGGPSTQYSGTSAPPLGQPMQKMYKDWNGISWEWPNNVDASWEITENGIYYQAAYAKLLAKFVTAPPLPTEAPSAPANVSAQATGTTSIALQWSKSDFASSYDIEVDGVVQNNGPSIAYTHEGLEQGSTHVYRVRAKNNVGMSSWSNPVSAVTDVPPPPPQTPEQISADATSSFAVLVSWETSAGATKYELEVDGVVLDNGSLTSYEHNGLASQSTHSYRVRAINSGGRSEWSNRTTVKTPQAPPTSIIDLSHNGNSGYTFGQAADQVKRYQTFIADSYPVLTRIEIMLRKAGLPGQVTVELYATEDNKPSGSVLASSTIASSEVTEDYAAVSAPLSYDGLIAGVKYAIVLGQSTPGHGGIYEWLAGYDVFGGYDYGKQTVTEWVDESHIGDGWMKLHVAQSVEPQQQIPAVPAGATVVAASTDSALLSWQSVQGAQSYEIEIDGEGPYISTAELSYIHSGLAPGSTHSYRIRAVNNHGDASDWTNPVAIAMQQSSSSVIDISHNGTFGYTFGESRDQLKRWQMFVANAKQTIEKIQVNVRKFGNTSNMTVSLYATKNNKPSGSALKTITVPASSISEDFAVIDVPLTYTGLINGASYAIVLGQVRNSDYSTYEWLTSAVNDSLTSGKYSGGKWMDESAIGDGWLKIFVV
ncbi:glycoside hydrolase family 9 protein [Paenibacillus sp. HB172176]|uniref:glycoside hydrolase family 9 protein n=1 Tax=Paenibacillus sp. HB172176 TaxID=2493690 RepID=UPI00143B884E|nr:glycoside hydrolase family 9 protein [Paenibacillus sp. HB172176]